jgi:endonuclease YncB( thermonuclease family)
MRKKRGTIRRKIKGVVDGDTFITHTKIQGTNRIRIANMNAPERGQQGYGRAKQKLGRLKGEVVTLIPRAKSYGRLVADVRHRRRKIR